MSNYIKIFVICFLAFCLGFGFNNFAKSDAINCRIAVVDTSIIIENSSEVKALKLEQENAIKELNAWLDKAKDDIDKQANDEDKDTLMKKYDNEFVKKQQELKQNYEKKLKTIDNHISEIIAKQAKSMNYTLVLTKSMVLFGGDDITDIIVKQI